MGDRVRVLKDGYLQQVDTPQNLYDRPDNVFVAAFIGSPSMNLYEAELTVDGDVGTLQLGSQQLAIGPEVLDRRPALRGSSARRLIVGIRPEDFEDAALVSGVEPGRCLQAPVQLIEALGSEIMVHFGLDARSVDSGDPDALEEASIGRVHVGRRRPLQPPLAPAARRCRPDRRDDREHALLRRRHPPGHLGLTRPSARPARVCVTAHVPEDCMR